MEFNQFAFWLLTGLFTIVAVCMGWLLVWLINEIKQVRESFVLEISLMRKEMSSLNEKLAQVVTNQDWHGKEILRLDRRIEICEHKTKNS